MGPRPGPLEDSEDRFGVLGSRNPELCVDDEERDAGHPKLECLSLVGPNLVGVAVAGQDVGTFLRVEPDLAYAVGTLPERG